MIHSFDHDEAYKTMCTHVYERHIFNADHENRVFRLKLLLAISTTLMVLANAKKNSDLDKI